MPWESLPPLIIIAGAVTAMGAVQQGVHRFFHGKPKAVAADAWDRKLDARDAGIRAATKARFSASPGPVRALHRRALAGFALGLRENGAATAHLGALARHFGTLGMHAADAALTCAGETLTAAPRRDTTLRCCSPLATRCARRRTRARG
jgi:hypothetical protein